MCKELLLLLLLVLVLALVLLLLLLVLLLLVTHRPLGLEVAISVLDHLDLGDDLGE